MFVLSLTIIIVDAVWFIYDYSWFLPILWLLGSPLDEIIFCCVYFTPMLFYYGCLVYQLLLLMLLLFGISITAVEASS